MTFVILTLNIVFKRKIIIMAAIEVTGNSMYKRKEKNKTKNNKNLLCPFLSSQQPERWNWKNRGEKLSQST